MLIFRKFIDESLSILGVFSIANCRPIRRPLEIARKVPGEEIKVLRSDHHIEMFVAA
jgi:hypothetical protein